MRRTRLFDWFLRSDSPARRRGGRAHRRPIATGLDILEGRLLLAYGIVSLGRVAVQDTTDVTQGFVALNAAGDVASTGYSNNVAEAYLLKTNGQITWLPPLPGGSISTAMAVNASDEVAGYSSTPISTAGETINLFGVPTPDFSGVRRCERPGG